MRVRGWLCATPRRGRCRRVSAPAVLRSRCQERERVTVTMQATQALDRLSIQLLGDFSVTVGSRAIDEREWTSRRARSLVKLLALAPRHRLHREHVMDRLWPDMCSEDGANNLHKALYMARRILEPDLPPRRASSYLQLRHDMLALEAPASLWIDVEAFMDATTEATVV